MPSILIVGAGLAGACAALHFAGTGPVTVLEAEQPAAGASGAAAGLVNPLMARKANPAWRMEAALEAFHATLARADAADLFRPTGVLRPAHDRQQARWFQERADALPRHAAWLAPEAVAERWPDVAAEHGALHVRAGGAIDLPALVRALLDAAQAAGAVVRTGTRVVRYGETEHRAWVETATGERLEARHVLLTPGDGFRRVEALAGLGLHRVKGQTVRVARPPGLDLPTLSGLGYVVPEAETVVVGSSYEHDFADVRPSAEQSARLVARAARMVPALAGAEVLEARAGVRVTVPRATSPQRLPMLGPLPGHRRVWALVGLGSKGLLTAPLLTRDLARFLRDPDAIPPEVRLR